MPATSPRSAGYLLAAAISFVISLLIVSPFFFLGNASGHDFEFHIASWLEVSNQWHHGILFPRWAEWPNFGFGEPRFLFYPPLSWLLAPLLSFVVPWNFVPVAFIIAVQTFAGVCSFVLTKWMAPERSYAAPLFAAACYAANPNALLIIYMRSDFAELLASAFFPLLLLVALKLTDQLPREGNQPASRARSVVAFAALFATVWLSNAPAGVMATYAMTLFLFWTALVGRSWRPLFRGAVSMALGFGLTGFYLIPAAFEQRWVNISQVLSSGLQPSQNFLYTSIDDPEHNLFNWMASTTAIVMIVLTGLAALAVLRGLANSPNRDAAQCRTRAVHALLLLSAAATLMMLHPSSALWNLLPKLRFVQFPWRWMSTLAVPYAYFLGQAVVAQPFPVAPSAAPSRLLRSLWICVTAVTVLGFGAFFVRHTWWDPDDVPTLQAAMTSGAGFEGTDEYDPVGDDHYNLPAKVPPAQLFPALTARPDAPAPLPTSLVILRWTAEQRVVRLDSSVPARLALRILNYPAWRIERNGVIVQPLPSTDDTNRMILAIPAGESLLRVSFTRTPDRTAGALLSLASVGIALALLATRKIC